MDDGRPHVVIIHLGTNDTYLGIPMGPYTEDGGSSFMETASGRLAHLIAYLLKWHNGLEGEHLHTIFVSQIIPNLNHPDKIDEFNAEVARIVQDATNGLIPEIPPGVLRLVDQNSTFNTGTMLDPGEKTHPNDYGYQHMGDVLFSVFKMLPMHLIASGSGQVGLPNTVLSQLLSVQALNGYGVGVPDISVLFETIRGDATVLSSPLVQTDALGMASATVQVGWADTSTIAAVSSGLLSSEVNFDVFARYFVYISGQVEYYSNQVPVPDVSLHWTEREVVVGETDDGGFFTTDSLPLGEPLTMVPEKQGVSLESDSTILSFDAALVSRYDTGLDTLSHAQRLAADVNDDGFVNTDDAVHIGRYVVGLDTAESAIPGRWIFDPPFLAYDLLTMDLSEQNFAGILSGDVHGGWCSEVDTATAFEISLGEPDFPYVGDTVTVPLQVWGEGVLSCDFKLEYRPEKVSLVGISTTEESETFNLNTHSVEEGKVRVGMYSPLAAGWGAALVRFQFFTHERWNASFVEFRDVYVNDTYLGDDVVQKGFESKWDRVLDLGKEITRGDVADRLWVKDEILSILLAEEPNYPIFYVDASATGVGDGSSWEDAFTTLQPAIDAAAEVEGWVWVAKGTYSGSYWEDGEVVCAVKIKPRVMVFGGFSGNEVRLAARNPEVNETIIQNMDGPGPEGPRAVDMEHLTLIDGFTIRDSGYRDYPDQWADNVAGGGIRTMSWFSIIRDNRITGNHAKSGGGIAIWGLRDDQRIADYAPIVERNLIYGNHGVCGAGVHIGQSEALFCNNVVYDNSYLTNPGDPDKSKGVEIAIDPSISDSPIVVNSILWGNSRGTFPDLYNHVDHTGEAVSQYNCIEVGAYGEGTISFDPLFTDPENADFSLQEESPCIDTGHPDGPSDPDGSRADMGVFYTLRYPLVIDDGGVGANTMGAGWYFPGTVVTISADSVVVDSLGTTRYSFLRWEGEGPGSYSGDSLTKKLRMDGPITERIEWMEAYWLQVNSGTEVDSVSGWYDSGTEIPITVPTFVEVGEGERRRFISWSGEGAGSVGGADTSIRVTMEGPVVQTAHWETQYFLEATVSPPYSGEVRLSPPDFWYADGTEVQLEAVGWDTSIVFIDWSGDAEGIANPTTVLIDGPKKVVANFAVTSNVAPRFVLDLPDTTIDEDAVLCYSFSVLSRYVNDLNDPADSLGFFIENDTHFSVEKDTQAAELCFHPETNWNGSEEIVLRVVDPGGLFASDTFEVTVEPQNDYPEPFQLLSPLDGAVLPDSGDFIFFVWEQSVNLDSGDVITYRFFVGLDSLFSSEEVIQLDVGEDTTVFLNRDLIAGTVYWGVKAVDALGGLSRWCRKRYQLSVPMGIEEEEGPPRSYALFQNFPNPFNSGTQISYQIPRAGRVKLLVFNTRGRLVRTLVDGEQDVGCYTLLWDGRDDEGDDLSSGVYLYRMETRDFVRKRKMILLR